MLVAACGGGDSAPSGSQPAAAVTTGSAAEFNKADVVFAQGMIPHHEQAIEMADMALDPTVGAGEAIRALATRIKAAQDPEVALMKQWLTAWAQPIEMDTSDGHDMSSMEGMMSVGELDALGALTGSAFDKQWAAMMIEHHRGAISMANEVKSDGSNADVIKLADAIIAGQQSEIDELTPLAAG